MVEKPPAIRVLGSIEVDGEAGPISLGARQHILLAVLAAEAGSVVDADVLIDAIWPDDATGDRSGALHTLVSRLRPRLPDAALVTQSPGYVLAADADLLDLTRFEQLVGAADHASPSEALALLDEALALWRGRAFGTVADRAAVQPRATESDELRTIARERRARLLIDLDRPRDAVAPLESLIHEHPFREEPVALVMEALARSGRHTDALRRFAAFRERLVEEVGLDPSADLQRVQDVVLNDGFERGRHQASGEAAAPSPFPLRLKPDAVERRPGEAIAYATIGSGPPLVFMPGWISSLDAFADGTDPRGALVARLADDFTVTVFDRFGTGLSPATDVDTSLDASVDEVRAVLTLVDDGATLVASSAAGPAALLASARNPAVSHLVLLCTYASGPALFTNPGHNASMIDLVEQSWGAGSKIIADMIVPGIDAVTRSAFARFQRRTARPEIAAGYSRQLFDADASSALAQIEQPCLIMHYRDDSAIPYDGSRQLALGIDDTELMPLDGPYHTPPPEHIDQIAAAIVRFSRRS